MKMTLICQNTQFYHLGGVLTHREGCELLIVHLCCILSIQHMGVGPMAVSDAAARIVSTVQSLYQVSVNQTLVTEQLIRAFSNQLSMLASQPLSPEAQLYLNKQLQDMQLQNR